MVHWWRLNLVASDPYMLFYSPNFEKSLSVSKWAAKLEIEVWLLVFMHRSV
jgi:hypothetical protein